MDDSVVLCERLVLGSGQSRPDLSASSCLAIAPLSI